MGQSTFKLILNIRHLKAFIALFLFVFFAHAEAACLDKRYWVATDDGSDKFWHDTEKENRFLALFYMAPNLKMK